MAITSPCSGVENVKTLNSAPQAVTAKPTFIKKEPGTTSTTAPQQQQQPQNQQTNAPVTQDFQQFTLRGKAFPPPMRLGGPTVTNSANTDNGPSRLDRKSVV